MKKKSYQTIVAYSVDQLDEKINNLIDDGYIPCGHVRHEHTQNGPKYYVGMILKEVMK